ncbi:MAG: hypothetical protein AB7S87_16895 [Burkholderiales bacterium]
MRSCACCPATIPAWLLFCRAHYSMLPKSLNRELHEEYRYMKRERVQSTERWIELRRRAVAIVTEKLAKRAIKKRDEGDLLAAA